MNTQNPSEILHTETPDRTADMGPRQRGDTVVWFWTIIAGLAAFTSAVLAYEWNPALCWLPLVVLGIPCAYGVWCIYKTHADRAANAPKSHNVLAGELGFDLLCACRGVAATAFFTPDAVAHGGKMKMLLFLENYMSRQRIVTARFGHLAGLGRPKATYARLHLAPGQAAVYCLPVEAAADIAAGFHHLSVTLSAEQPEGVGQRLEGARTRLRNMKVVRFAAPFELETGRRPEAHETKTALTGARYLSLASISEKQPDLERLHALMAQE